MSVASLERSWEEVPAFFGPEDGPVAPSKLGIGARPRQGPGFGQRAQSLRYGFEQGTMPLAALLATARVFLDWPPRLGAIVFRLSLGDQVWTPASTDSAVSIEVPPAL